MYALNPGVTDRKQTPFISLGETRMKKILLALLMAVAGYAHAVATDTPTLTPTFTPSPTLTPTRTNTPVALDGQKSRVIVQAQQFLLNDGVSRPVTTPVPGSADIWFAQTLSWTSAVFSTNTAAARIQLTVPADYMRNGSLWLHSYDSVTYSTTVVLQADVYKLRLNGLTSTAVAYIGLTQPVQTQFIGRMNNARYSRVWVALSGTVGTSGVLQPGDLLNIDIQRSGSVGNLNVFAAEFEYAVNYPLRP